MPQECDNLSVGVIIENGEAIALLRRAKFPIAVSPPAGHIDQHGSPEQAAIDEVHEELGLTIAAKSLVSTAITNRYVSNQCRRPRGDHHSWTVFQARDFTGELNPSPSETKGAGWYSRRQLQELADRTKALRTGQMNQADWQETPGLEEVWLNFMVELEYVR